MKSVLFVIDVQNLYSDVNNEYYIGRWFEVVSKINTIIDRFPQKDDIYYFRHEHKVEPTLKCRHFDFDGNQYPNKYIEGSNEVQFINMLNVVNNNLYVKNTYSVFGSTDINDVLLEKSVEEIIIVGFMTNVCCESTARNAHDLGYFTKVIIDATGTISNMDYTENEILMYTQAILKNDFSVVMKSDELLEFL